MRRIRAAGEAASDNVSQAAQASRPSWRSVVGDDYAALEATLVAVYGDRKRAAQALGVSRATVARWLDRWPEIAKRHPPLTRGRPTGARDRRPRRPAGSACLALLGLSWPCTRSDVVKAWRRVAFAAHPDGAGSNAAFIKARRAYETALTLVNARRR